MKFELVQGKIDLVLEGPFSKIAYSRVTYRTRSVKNSISGLKPDEIITEHYPSNRFQNVPSNVQLDSFFKRTRSNKVIFLFNFLFNPYVILNSQIIDAGYHMAALAKSHANGEGQR